MNNGNVSHERVGCAAGRKFISITPEGLFKPCSHQSVVEKADSIEEYLKSRSFENVVFHSNSICRSCVYKNICRSCRAITEDYNFEIGKTDCIGYKKNEI